MDITHTRTRGAALAAAAVLALSGLAACGGDGDSNDSNDSVDASNAVSESTDNAAGAAAETPATDDDAAGNDAEGAEGTEGAEDTDSAGDDASGNGTSTDGADGTTCATDSLSISLDNQQGAAGSTLADITFTNDGDSECVVDGYPGVTFVDDADNPVGAPATREPAGEASPVTLAPGESAVSAVKISRAENYGEAECSPTPASGLQVIPPEETAPTVTPLDNITACASDEVELLSVQPAAPAA